MGCTARCRFADFMDDDLVRISAVISQLFIKQIISNNDLIDDIICTIKTIPQIFDIIREFVEFFSPTKYRKYIGKWVYLVVALHI